MFSIEYHHVTREIAEGVECLEAIAKTSKQIKYCRQFEFHPTILWEIKNLNIAWF